MALWLHGFVALGLYGFTLVYTLGYSGVLGGTRWGTRGYSRVLGGTRGYSKSLASPPAVPVFFESQKVTCSVILTVFNGFGGF